MHYNRVPSYFLFLCHICPVLLQYPDLKHIGIAYTNTPDEKHEIQFELNLEDFTATQLVDGKEISHYDYVKENGNEEKALDCM